MRTGRLGSCLLGSILQSWVHGNESDSTGRLVACRLPRGGNPRLGEGSPSEVGAAAGTLQTMIDRADKECRPGLFLRAKTLQALTLLARLTRR